MLEGANSPHNRFIVLYGHSHLAHLKASLVAQLVKNAGDLHSIPGLGRSPGEGKGYPPQYSGRENSTDVYGVTESDMTEQLSLTLLNKNQRKNQIFSKQIISHLDSKR